MLTWIVFVHLVRHGTLEFPHRTVNRLMRVARVIFHDNRLQTNDTCFQRAMNVIHT